MKRNNILLVLIVLIGALALAACSSNVRRENPPTPGQTRTTIPGPTRVGPSTTDWGNMNDVNRPNNLGPNATRDNQMNTRDNELNLNSNNNSNTPRNNNSIENPMQGARPGPNTTDNGNDNTSSMARNIAREIEKDNNIRSAHCVVNGKTALIGLELNSQNNGKVTDDIKKSVEEKVKDIEPSINKVVVTADPDILTRIQNMVNDIGDGKPLSGIGNEIEEIIRRINPF